MFRRREKIAVSLIFTVVLLKIVHKALNPEEPGCVQSLRGSQTGAELHLLGA